MIVWTALILGLVGSLHCAGMCGPLALALPVTGTTRTGFVTGRLMYNLGRLVTYCLLGVIFGLVGRTLALAGIQRWVSISLGLALLFGVASSRKLALWGPVMSLIGSLKFRMSTLLRERSLSSLVVLGMLNGLLPCGLVYVACAGATATGTLLSGAQYMAMFGLGTIPMMLGIGLCGRLMPMALRLHLRKAVPASVCLLAGLLILRGLSLGIPYLSPDLSSTSTDCCQKYWQK
jgi:sulfite exporter TauE/SafE